MIKHLERILLPISIALIPALLQCGPQLKDELRIDTPGFLSEHCYQAILEIEPDPGAWGLVARRESAAQKAADRQSLHMMALAQIADHTIQTRISEGTLKRNTAISELETERTRIAEIISGFIGRGRIAFTYYNERNSMMVGYRLYKTGLKNRLDAVTGAQGD